VYHPALMMGRRRLTGEVALEEVAVMTLILAAAVGSTSMAKGGRLFGEILTSLHNPPWSLGLTVMVASEAPRTLASIVQSSAMMELEANPIRRRLVRP